METVHAKELGRLEQERRSLQTRVETMAHNSAVFRGFRAL
jgi:hypothetical protein